MATADISATELADELEHTAAHLGDDLEKLLRSFAPVIREEVQSHFDNSARADGSDWPEHAPSTVQRYGPHPLLILSGELERAATGQGANHVEEIEGNALVYGVQNLPYAATHQYGDPDRNIPEREYLGLSEQAEAELADLAADFFAARIMGNN